MKFRKKKRYWVCENCGTIFHRIKNETEKIHCGFDMKKTRTMDLGHRIQNKRYQKKKLIVDRIRNYEEQYCSKIRNGGGQVLKVSRNTKELWRKVSRSKTKPSILKYANLWIKSLEEDTRKFDDNEKNWAKSISYTNGQVTKSRGGWSAPTIKYTDNFSQSLHGKFSAGLMLGGCFIEINRSFDLNNIKHTILHEALHYLDSLAKIEGGHDCYWDIRLKRMEDIFKIK